MRPKLAASSQTSSARTTVCECVHCLLSQSNAHITEVRVVFHFSKNTYFLFLRHMFWSIPLKLNPCCINWWIWANSTHHSKAKHPHGPCVCVNLQGRDADSCLLSVLYYSGLRMATLKGARTCALVISLYPATDGFAHFAQIFYSRFCVWIRNMPFLSKIQKIIITFF